jgi:hypothetical protein
MPRKPRKTDTARIAEWVSDAISTAVSAYVAIPSEDALRWMYQEMWRSILEVFEQSAYQIKVPNLDEVTRTVAERVAVDMIVSRYPELPPDRLRFWARRVADVIYADVWRYVISYITTRRLVEDVERRERRVRRPRYRTSHHVIYYVFRRIEEELYGLGI